MLKIIQEDSSPQQPWYINGLHFKCTECGQCCTGAPGYVWVTEAEIQQMAHYLNLPLEEFFKRYIRRIGERLSLREHSKTYDCIFLKNKKCQIYPVRPIQCRTFPWWPQNLKSKDDWQEAAKSCEGICANAPLIPFNTIQEQLAVQEEQPHHA